MSSLEDGEMRSIRSNTRQGRRDTAAPYPSGGKNVKTEDGATPETVKYVLLFLPILFHPPIYFHPFYFLLLILQHFTTVCGQSQLAGEVAGPKGSHEASGRRGASRCDGGWRTIKRLRHRRICNYRRSTERCDHSEQHRVGW